MPPLPNVPNVIKMEVGFSQGTLKGVCIFHAQFVGGPIDTADLDLLDGAIESYWGALFSDQMDTEKSFDTVTYTDLTSDTGATTTVPYEIGGTLASGRLAGSTCLLISHRISRRYRGGHPRTYFPCGDAGSVATDSFNTWSSDFIDTMSTAMANWEDAVNGYSGGAIDSLAHVNVSYNSGGTRRVTPVVDLIEANAVQSRMCTQKRRLGKLVY